MGMTSFRLEDDTHNFNLSKGKKCTIIVLFIILLSLVCIVDDFQQHQFATFKAANEFIEENNYSAAEKEINKYVACDVELYWKIIEEILGYEYTREGVQEALRNV